MDTFHQEINNTVFDKIPVHRIEEIQFEKVLKVIKKRELFKRYSQLIEYNTFNESLTDKTKLLKTIITNEIELNEFIRILLHTGYDSIAKEIDPNVIDLCDLTRCDPENGHKDRFSFGDENTKEIVENPGKDVSISFSGGLYPMIWNPRGFCYLINNYFTIGTYKEMQRLRNIFYQLYFDVILEKNLSIKQIKDLLDKQSRNGKLLEHNAFMFLIITNGDNKRINDSNNDSEDIVELTQLFNDEKCPNMVGKPRLFFFNCIQNESLVESSQQSVVTEASKISSPSDDIFICVSTLEKNVNWDKGTEFGRQFANSLVKKAWYKDMISITNRTNHLMRQMFNKNMQRTTLNKTLYFNHLVPEKRAYFSEQTICSTNPVTEQTLENLMSTDLGQNLNVKVLIELSEQLCKELKALHTNGRTHNDINPGNILISIPKISGQREALTVGAFGNTKVQFRDNMTDRSSNEGNLCWRSPEVLQALNNSKSFEPSEENDIFSLGCLIYYIMTRGKPPFDFESGSRVKNLNALSGPKNHIYIDLIEKMLNNSKTERAKIDSVLIHPMFWDSNKILSFYTDIRDLFRVQDDKVMKTKDFTSIQGKVIHDLKSKSKAVCGDNWLGKLPKKIQDYENKQIDKARKNTRGVHFINDTEYCIGLIVYIRNKGQHFIEWLSSADITAIGESVESYIKYFTDEFPLLLIYTYNAMQKLKAERKLDNYYI